jgi:hypothetical protein
MDLWIWIKSGVSGSFFSRWGLEIVFIWECCIFWICRFIVLREVLKEVPMFMAFATYEWYMLIIQGLDPLCIFMGETYRVWQVFGDVHVDADLGVGSVFFVFSFLCYFDKVA